MTLLQALKLALKGYTSNKKQVFVLVVRKKTNELYDVTDLKEETIKDIIKSERDEK